MGIDYLRLIPIASGVQAPALFTTGPLLQGRFSARYGGIRFQVAPRVASACISDIRGTRLLWDGSFPESENREAPPDLPRHVR